jgi:threonine/homoserine/homoserine lactone efflux protein
MNILLLFLTGFIAAVVGILPPGLINLTAAKVSLTDGKKRGMMFVLGALLIICFQTYISVVFAKYINKHEEVVIILREIGLVIFTVLTLFFLFFAKRPSINKDQSFSIKSSKSRFLYGMFISGINVFPIPYYVLISITLAAYQVFYFKNIEIFSLVTGVVFGSFVVFYFYVSFFNKMKAKADYFMKNMNKIIGSITGVVALITLYNVLKYYSVL